MPPPLMYNCPRYKKLKPGSYMEAQVNTGAEPAGWPGTGGSGLPDQAGPDR